MFRLLARQYEYILIDAGSQINSVAVAALYTADTMFLVANPDVPSVRNAQRLLDRVRQLGACGERVRVLLNRAAEPYPIPPKQIEGALGHPIHHTFPSDYKTVSTALNSGVPLALTGNSDIAAQFDSFTRQIVDPAAARAGASRPSAACSASTASRPSGNHAMSTPSIPPFRRVPRPAPVAHRPGRGRRRRRASSISSSGRTCTGSC